MRRDIAELWAEALESGDYPQAKGFLVVVNSQDEPIGYCCLGVLTELAQAQGVQLRVETQTENQRTRRCLYFDGSYSFLPPAVKAWAQMKDDDMVSVTFPAPASLVELNDNGIPFTQIAQAIRDNWEIL
jgi:hypothetical protein